MEDQSMSIKVSGRTVYGAVKNYLNNHPELRAAIDKVVTELVNSGHLQAQVERLVRQEVVGYRFANLMTGAITKVVDTAVKTEIEKQVQASIKKTLANSVFVMPKLDE